MAKSKASKTQYPFRLLREESVDNDLFEDKTHEKIAESILELITTQEKGISIGMEGPWGSGKSTVISILEKKLKKNNNQNNNHLILLIQFDAWAHQGTPLRRIFLESLIDELEQYVNPKGKNGKFNDLKREIAHRQKTTTITTTRTATVLGKLLSIALFFVPIGVALLSNVDYNVLSFSGEPYWLFIFGLISSAAPLLVVIGNLIMICIRKELRKRGVWNSKNWSFLQDKAEEEIIQEVSEEDERTSIEFEQYFEKIMEILFGEETKKETKKEIKKLILVVDNLDRIDVDDALKIWSTLQIFLSQRTQTYNKKDWFDKIWIIVPYDSEGLSRLWNRSINDIKQDLSKPFFDKCFQLRIEVPKPIFSGWEKFARDMMNNALKGWTQSDKDELIRILRMTRKDLTDIPTPRGIKNYINQVGFLASQWGHIMSMSSIAYYVCWRELANKSVKEIKSKLVINELIEPRHKALLPEKCIEELSGLIFGVAPEKGFQLLLEPKITSVLKNGDGKGLKELCKKHGDGFWHIFNYYIEHHDMDLSLALDSTKAIYDSLWKDNSEKCNEFINKVSKIDMSAAPEEIKWDKQEIDKYICLIEICHKEKVFIQKVYQHLITCLRNSIKKDPDINWERVITSLSKIVNTLLKKELPIHQETIEELSLSKLIPLVKTPSVWEHEIYKWIAPSKDIVKEISEVIVPGDTLQEGLTEVVQYSIESGIKNGWDVVLAKCREYINWNDGNYSNQSDEIFKIINTLVFKLHDRKGPNQFAFNIAKIIVTSGPYHNLFWHRKTQNSIHAALLCAYVLGKGLQSETIPVVGNSTAGFNEIKKLWKNSDINTARQILEEMKKYHLWSFLWEVSTDENNKLVKDIISEARDDKGAVELFRVKDALVEPKNFSNFFENTDDEDEKVLKLIEKFTEYADLENEIIAADYIDLIEYNYELYLIIKQTKNQQVITKIANELRNINKKAWIESLRGDTYLTSLALEVKRKQGEFFLENSFTDALVEFVKSQSGYTDWQKEHWHELILLMGESFQEYYRGKITDYLCTSLTTISSDTFNLNKEYFLYKEVLNKTKVIQDAVDSLVKEKQVERLQLLNEILSKDTKGEFKPEDYFIDVIRGPLQALYSEQDSEEIKSVIKFLAEKFSIPLQEDSEKEIEKEE